MVPGRDKAGHRTASLVGRYAVYSTALPVLACATGARSSMSQTRRHSEPQLNSQSPRGLSATNAPTDSCLRGNRPSELSRSVASKSIRLIFGRIDGSRRALEAEALASKLSRTLPWN